LKADFAHYYPGKDLGQMFRDRRWLDLLTLIDWLPRNSAYIETLSEDEEIAEEYLSRPESASTRNPGPRISEWSPELERLTDLVDRMGEVMIAVVASQGGKAPKIRPFPRPRTAIDRVRERKRYEKHKRTVARVIIQRVEEPIEKVAIAPPGAPMNRPVILPGEDPFRLKAPRSRPQSPMGDAVTGEPKKSDT
jgi:hypothetical protein